MRAYRLILLAGAALVAGALLFAFDPREWSFFPRCPLHLLVGWFCPGCGSQRALHLLLHGDVREALRYNALLVSTLPLLGYIGIRRLAWVRWRRVLPAPHTRSAALWTLAGIVVIFFVLRNLPAFAWLAPPA